MEKIICIYHGNCADGFTAAWVVKSALGPEVKFVAGTYGEEPPNVKGAHVIMVDFSYKRPVIEAMATQARSILILDHHVTAQEDLAGFPEPVVDDSWDAHLNFAVTEARADWPRVVFDMKRSGAQIAWDFFFPGSPRPRLVDYVGDRDLWRFVLPDSRAISAWLFSRPYAFGGWESARNYLDDGRLFAEAVKQGQAILRKQDKDIRELVAVMRRPMKIGGCTVPVANLPYTLASDAANLLSETAEFAACYFDRADGLRVFSLRSQPDGTDVAKIAEIYGGGGHANAAGFQVPIGWEGDDHDA